MRLVRRLSRWLDGQGDLMLASNRLFSFGPFVTFAALLTFVRTELSMGAWFWLVAAACACFCAVYYVAFVKALVRQRERFYRREVRPKLGREYSDR